MQPMLENLAMQKTQKNRINFYEPVLEENDAELTVILL